MCDAAFPLGNRIISNRLDLKRKTAGLKALEDFADGLTKDISAVTKAFTQALSNGITEGVVNKIKMIKRKAYGRAKFDLLRARVLRAP